MRPKRPIRSMDRTGTVAALLSILMLPMLALLALFVDYGFLLYIRTDLQRTADQAALAAVQDLVPDSEGNQDYEKVREKVIEFVRLNLGQDFDIQNSDIEIGRYNPETIYDSLEILNDGTADTVRVTVRRDDSANQSVSLYFARLFDSDSEDITATSAAVLQRANLLAAGAAVMPFAVPDTEWDSLQEGDEWNIYGDGRIEDGVGNPIPGNWGSVDVGPANNSTNDLQNQIVEGLRQSDLDSLYDQGAIPSPDYIDTAQNPLLNLSADPGLSAGIKLGVEQVHGLTKIVPIYDSSLLGNGNSDTSNGNGNGNSGGGGNNASYTITGWGVVEVVDSSWNGSKNTYINVRRGNLYDGNMIPNPDLGDTSNNIDGAFTSPVLVQ